MAGLVDFVPINTSDRDIQLIQNELSRCIGQLTSLPILTGTLKQVSFPKVDTDVFVTHNLGSQKVSWFAGGMNFPAHIFTSPNKNAPSSNQIVLQCETPVTAISLSNPLQAYVWIYLVS